MELRGTVALVTGGNGGLGQRICHALAREGVHIAVMYAQSRDQAEGVARDLAASHQVNAAAFGCDITDAGAVTKLVGDVTARFGRLDILINDAAFNHAVRFNDLDGLTEDLWDKIMAVNLTGPMRLIKAVAPVMKAQGRGRIVNIASVSGVMGNAGQANYSAAKAGMIGLTKTLAREFAGRSVTVNAVAPGFIKTDMTTEFVNNPEASAKILEVVPLRRFGESADVAHLATYLCSEQAGYITGQVFNVDGGMAM